MPLVAEISAYLPAIAAGAAGVILCASGVAFLRRQRIAERAAAERLLFVNHLSRQLGAPLEKVLMDLNLASDSLHGEPEQAQQRLSAAVEELRRVSRLVGNVLSFSERASGALKLDEKPAIPDVLLASLIDHFEPSLRRSKITFEPKLAARIGLLLDPLAFLQIVGNLVANVERHAASGGWLGLESRVEGDTLIIRVSDRGPGIPTPQRQRIFRPREKAADAGSLGVGLAVARELAQRMGGSLEFVDSSTGAAFELRLPARRVETPLVAA